jgi:hypothetical protein
MELAEVRNKRGEERRGEERAITNYAAIVISINILLFNKIWAV